MNEDTLAGRWKQITGEVKQQWGKLTDDDLRQIDGSRERLEGRLQERYGLARDEAKRQVDEFARRI